MKKGSMELGVNAIVILIIALAILGLGIAFVTNLFGSGSDKLGSIIDNTELPIHADPSQKVKFETSELTIKKGKRESLKVSVYNDGFATSSEVIDLELASCRNSDNSEESGIRLAAPGQSISPGSDGGYIAVFTVSDDVSPDTYICTVQTIGGGASGQLIIEVTL